MSDMKFTTAGEMAQDYTWVLSPHGKQKHTARWVLETYDGRVGYEDNKTVQMWIAASRQIIESDAEERSSLFVGSGE